MRVARPVIKKQIDFDPLKLAITKDGLYYKETI